MRFWRRREGTETADAFTEDAESLPSSEESSVETAQPEPAPESAEERRGWLGRLRAGMARSSARLTQGINTIFTRRRLDDEALFELEELLIASDMGVGVVRRSCRSAAQDPVQPGGLAGGSPRSHSPRR